METNDEFRERIRREQRLAARLHLATERLQEAQRERIWAVVEAHESGLSIRQIAAATGLTAIGESVGVGGLSATGVVAKILTAAAIATVAVSSGHSDRPFVHRAAAPPTTRERLLASVPARSAPRAAGPFISGSLSVRIAWIRSIS